jgi:BlaI family penicillinase repressor
MQTEILCDSEYRFMQLVWANAPISSGRLVELCAAQIGWKKSTTYTVLKKLCEKGIVSNEDAMVRVLVAKEEVTSAEAEQFVDKTFGGSLPGFLTAFMSGKRLTGGEAERLKALIDAHREGE